MIKISNLIGLTCLATLLWQRNWLLLGIAVVVVAAVLVGEEFVREGPKAYRPGDKLKDD